MATNNPRQPKRSWKDDKPAGGRPGQRGWRAEKSDAGATKGPILTRRGKIILAASGLLIGVVVLAIVLLWPKPNSVPRFVLVGAGYQTNLAQPENVLGVRGLDAVQSWTEGYNNAAKGPGSKVDVRRATLTAGDDPLVEALKDCNSQTVVVYFAVHGTTDTQGEFLVPDDANFKTGGFKAYSLGQVLTDLGKLRPETKKLLVFDTTTAAPDLALGLLHNDFVRALKADQANLKAVPNLAVMVASDEDQRSWGSEEWGSTIFAHFFVEGLKGAASNNGTVTAKSLADYVTKQVGQWARDNRDARQTPILLFDQDNDITDGMVLAVVEAGDYKAPDAAELKKYEEPAGLRAEWKKRAELETSQPAPAVYAPQLWRQYLDTLKRFEDVLRAGDQTGAATTLATKLNELASKIRQSQRIEREELASSLAMPKALGWGLADADMKRTQQDFNTLWGDAKAKPEDFARKLKDWKDPVTDPLQRHLLRLQMESLLLTEALQSDAAFTRACDILANPGLNDSIAPEHPAEVHVALMFARYLPKDGRNVAAIKKALEVRRQAEEAVLGIGGSTPMPTYSEQILPWIRSDLEKASLEKPGIGRADAARRTGEDLLFAVARQAGPAAAATDKAAKEYSALQDKAAIVRQALLVRDRAFATLPYYTAWLATQPLSESEEKQYAELWDKVHNLAAALEKPDFAKIDDLARPTKDHGAGAPEIAAELRQLEVKFQESFPPTQADTQKTWHAIDDLLRVPFIDADRRMELLAQMRSTGWRFNSDKPSGQAPPSAVENSANEKKASQRRGGLAVAELGKTHPAAKDAEQAITRPSEAAWGMSLARAGDRLADAYQQMAQESFGNTEKVREAALTEAHPTLRTAALQSRQLPGAAAQVWAPDPVGRNRELDLHDLFVYQARRTFQDYWAGDDPKHPYYREAGEAYLTAARAMVGGEAMKARLTDVLAVDALLRQDDALSPRWLDGKEALAGPAEWQITDESEVTRAFKLEKKPGAPDGIPVVWAKPGKRLQPKNPDDIERKALVPDTNRTADAPVEYVLKVDHPNPAVVRKEESSYDFTGFFRGRVATLETKVWIYHRPEVASYLPIFENKGRVAIHADGDDFDRFAAANSELVIVLDYSGSMKKVTQETKNKPQAQQETRKDAALRALKECLRNVPRGVKVTILTFSEDGSNGRITPQLDKVEWDPARLGRTFDKLEALDPKYDTPLVRATVKGKDYFTPGFKGAKSLLVVTDGGDNEFNSADGAAMRKEGATMELYLKRQFKDTGILVNVIGIETDSLTDPDELAGLKEYRPAIENLRNPDGQVGGRFISVKDSAALAREIRNFLLQIHYQVDPLSELAKVPPDAVPAEGANISRENENIRWVPGLTEGRYTIGLQTNRLNKRALVQDIALARGDSLILALKPGVDGKGLLRRAAFGESHTVQLSNLIGQQRSPNDATWLVSVLQNQHIDNGTNVFPLQIMTTIEKLDDAAAPEKLLRMVRPQFVWFNVASTEQPATPVAGLRFYPLADYPAPAYSLDLPSWVGSKDGKEFGTILDLWWNQDPLTNCGRLPLNNDPLPDLEHHPLRPTDQDLQVVVEGITYETMPIEISPKQFVDKECLVVRLRYPKEGQPFFVQLADPKATAAEHRFYQEAGKYTGVFFLSGNARPEKPKDLFLYSVGEAQKKGRHIPAWNLKAPTLKDRPAKPKD